MVLCFACLPVCPPLSLLSGLNSAGRNNNQTDELTCRALCIRRGDFLTLQMGSRRHRTQRGVPQEVLDTLPCHEFKASELAASVLAAEATAAETPASGVLVSAVTFGSRPVTAPDVAANECSVCLAEYEEGELVRTLVNCSHMFHQKVRSLRICSVTAGSALQPVRGCQGLCTMPSVAPCLARHHELRANAKLTAECIWSTSRNPRCHMLQQTVAACRSLSACPAAVHRPVAGAT